MAYEVREYQVRAKEEIRKAFAVGFRKVGLMLPTGAGKTIIAQDMIRSALQRGKRVYFICDRLTLINQTAQRFYDDGFDFGIIQGQNEMYAPWKALQICSIQTIKNRQLSEPDLVIVDEFHTTYKRQFELMEEWKKTFFIGLSATPFTFGLGLHWETLINVITTAELMEMGFLSNYRAIVGHKKVDDTGMKKVAGDFNKREASERIAKKELVCDIFKTWKEEAFGLKTMVFAQNVPHANDIVKQFQENGVDARKVDCYMENQGEDTNLVIRDFKNGVFPVLVSVDMIVKGFDVTDVMCLVVARMTASLMWHIQALGRGLRAHPGKEQVLIFDHAGNIERLGFPDDPLPTQLCKKEKGEQKIKLPSKPKPCPQCRELFRGSKCPSCGYERKGELRNSNVEHVAGEMVEISKKSRNVPMSVKREFYAQVLGYARNIGGCRKGDKIYSDGWVAHTYRGKFDVWPRGMDNVKPIKPGKEVRDYIVSRFIKYSKSKAA